MVVMWKLVGGACGGENEVTMKTMVMVAEELKAVMARKVGLMVHGGNEGGGDEGIGNEGGDGTAGGVDGE